MKQITVKIDLGYGFSHYGSVSGTYTVELEVSDAIAAWVAEQLANDADGIGDELVMGEAKNSNALFDELHEIIRDKACDLDTYHWVMESFAMCDCQELVEKCFWEDIESGNYRPEKSYLDFCDEACGDADEVDLEDMDEDDEEDWNEEDMRAKYYNEWVEHYEEWLSRVAFDDPYTYADRMEMDDVGLQADLSYTILSVK